VFGHFNGPKCENRVQSDVLGFLRYRRAGATEWRKVLTAVVVTFFVALTALCDAAHRLEQGVLYFQAAMSLRSTQVRVASFSPTTKAAYGFH